VLDDSKEYLVQTRLVPVLRDAGLGSFTALVDSLRTKFRVEGISEPRQATAILRAAREATP